jgi:hypothetical protein
MDHCGAAAAIYPFKLPPLCAYMPVRNKLALAGHFDSGLAGSESPSVDRGSGQRPFAQMRRAPCGAVGLFPGVAEIAHETRGAFISAYAVTRMHRAAAFGCVGYAMGLKGGLFSEIALK